MRLQYLKSFGLMLLVLGGFSLGAQDISANYFQGDTLLALSQSGSAPSVTTFTIDQACEQLKMEVTDPVGAPLGTSKPYSVRVRNADGDRITDLTDRLTVTMRARSAGEVPVEFLFRSGDGTADFRTSRRGIVIPAGLDEWTEMSVTFEAADFGPSFDPADIRDFWFYLDRSNENFVGNEFYIDHIVIGGAPDPAQNSPCFAGGGGMETDTMFAAAYFQGDTLVEISQSGSAPSVTTFTYDADCEQLKIEITDPVGAPQGTSKPYSVRLRDADNNRVTNLTDRLTVTMRARSAGEVPVEFLFRSGDGTADFRTSRRGIVIPAGLDEWTEMSVTFEAADFGPSFDPSDIRDLWFYLDRSNENFAGNEFYIDHIVVGGAPNPEQNSPCMLGGGAGSDGYVQYFQLDTVPGEVSRTNAAARRLTFDVDTDCEAVVLSVTDSINDPLPAFNAVQVNPVDENGDDITDITGNVTVTMRVRSVAAVNLSILLRSGDGSSDFRTNRLDMDIPAGLEEWTTFTAAFSEADLVGFDPADLRDVWFYLDRGMENFAGNEFQIDHIAVGATPDPAFNSPCPIPPVGNSYVQYFQLDTLPGEVSRTNAAARRLTFDVDTDCEAVILSVTDSINDPLPAFNAVQVNPVDENGDDITDITGNVTVTMRVRSVAAVNLSVLLRSGDGSSDFRSNRLDMDIPAGLEEWTTFTAAFSEADLAGFDPADLRDVWFYLDRGEENFAGNEFHIDHIAVGTTPDPAFNSPCPIDDSGNPGVFVDYFQGDSLVSFTTTNAAGRRSNFAYDTACETLTLSVVDPVNDPLPPFNAFQVNPTDENGEDITDITGNMNVTMRVRSAEAVNVSILLRSGGGTMEERTERLAVDIPGNLDEWTEFTVTFTEADLAGFVPNDLRDIWFYLDRGEPNFAGNFFAIDHIAVGVQPDPAQNSPCSLVSVPTEFVVQFADTSSIDVLAGSEIDRFTLSTNDCEEVSIAVTDPTGAPFGAFRPIVINPTDASGAPITNIEGQTDVFIRARSAEEFPISVLFRSGDGSTDFRTNVVSKMVEGDLTGWSNLTFSFSEADLAGFDPTDLVDVWVYLDRENDNFPGNELYIDYIAIGSKPDTAQNSPCGLPDLISGTNEAPWAGGISLYPNPTGGLLTLEIPNLTGAANRITTRLIDLTGRAVRNQATGAGGGRIELDLTGLPAGVYLLELTDAVGGRALRRVVKQ